MKNTAFQALIFIGSELDSNDNHRVNFHNLRLVRNFKRRSHHSGI